MSNSYKYIDEKSIYIDPKTGVLRNLLGVEDEETLNFVESAIVTKKLKEFYENPIVISGVETLLLIHKLLFEEIYSWAGEVRTIEISKNGEQFFPTLYFEKGFNYVNVLIEEFKEIDKSDKLQLSQKLAEILDNVNYLHPFREGNGRTQREFLRLLALEKGFKLNLNPVDDSSVYEKYMKGTIESNVNILTELIFELINKTED